MENDLLKYAVWAFGFFVFYALLARGLFNATEQFRNSLLDIAANLLNSEKVSSAKKTALRRRLDEVHSPVRAWQIAFYALQASLSGPLDKDDEAKVVNGLPPHLIGDFNKFGVYWVISTVANSPMATLLAILIIVLRGTMSASVSALMKMIGFLHDRESRGGSVAH